MKNSLQANSIASPRPLTKRFKTATSLGIAFLTVLGFASPARATSIDSLFHSPVLTNDDGPGRVLVLPDDKFLVHYNFNRLNGENIGPLVKFNADGSRDTGFRMAGNFAHVTAVALASDGRLYVAAREQNKITPFNYRVLRLNGDGSLDSSFNAGAGADLTIYSLAELPDKKLLVGGVFTTFNGEDRPTLVRLNPDGSLDPSFARISVQPEPNNANGSGILSNIIIQPDGKILFGGNFTRLEHAGNQVSTFSVARVEENGTPDFTFSNTRPGFTPIRTLGLQSDNKILVGGRFNNITPGGSRTPLLRLNPNGSLERQFIASFGNNSDTITALKLLPNGDILGVGTRLFRFTTDGVLVPGYSNAFTVATAQGLGVQSDGKFLVARIGNFNAGLFRFSADNTAPPTPIGGAFQREILPDKLSVRTDGKIWLTDFWLDSVDGIARSGLARLLANGELDAVNPPSNAKVDFALHPDDKILVLDTPFAQARFRLNADDSGDESFQNSGDAVSQVLPAPEGQYMALNNFSHEAVAQDKVIFRLLSNGFRDPGFIFGIRFSEVAASPSNFYLGDNRPLAFYEDGRFLARYFDSTGNYHLKRFNSNGSVEPTFQGGQVPALTKTESSQFLTYTGPDGTFYANTYFVTSAPGTPLSDVLLLPDGKVIVVGMFSQYNGTAAPGIVRLLGNGEIDPTFNAGAGAQWVSTPVDATHIPRIDAIERLADGRFLITGTFEAYDGTAAPGIARLNEDGSRDDTFVSPVVLSSTYADISGNYPGFFQDFPVSQLVSQPDGSILLSGNYSQVGSDVIRSIFRLTRLTATAALNISTRMRVETGDNVLIGGFIITGNAPKKVIMRAIGPSLGALGVPDALENPTLELRGDGGVLLANNDDWRGTQQTEIEQSGFQPKNDFESAIIATLQPGQYTAIVAGKDGTTGAGLLEVYDLDRISDSELANISTRGFVQTGDNVMIGGFILGNSAGATRVLVRGIGPSLSGIGISDALQDPMLELIDGHGTQVASNDDWKDSQRALIEGTGIPPSRDEEPAILANLVAGNYTAIIRGKNNSTGVAAVEVYNIK